MSIRLVVGLGNFERRYELTPHNIGCRALEEAAKMSGLAWKETGDFIWASGPDGPALIKLKSYMNASGPLVKAAAGKWRAALAELLIVCDDFALPWGRLRLRASGSSGGHNGLKSIMESLGSQEFPRLRVGVGPVPEGMDPKDFVLQGQSRKRMTDLAGKAAEAVVFAAESGLEAAMNKFNSAQP